MCHEAERWLYPQSDQYVARLLNLAHITSTCESLGHSHPSYCQPSTWQHRTTVWHFTTSTWQHRTTVWQLLTTELVTNHLLSMSNQYKQPMWELCILNIHILLHNPPYNGNVTQWFYPSFRTSTSKSRMETCWNFKFEWNIPHHNCNWHTHFQAETTSYGVSRHTSHLETSRDIYLHVSLLVQSRRIHVLSWLESRSSMSRLGSVSWLSCCVLAQCVLRSWHIRFEQLMPVKCNQHLMWHSMMVWQWYVLVRSSVYDCNVLFVACWSNVKLFHLVSCLGTCVSAVSSLEHFHYVSVSSHLVQIWNILTRLMSWYLCLGQCLCLRKMSQFHRWKRQRSRLCGHSEYLNW